MDKPDFNKKVDIKAYLFNNFGCCGSTEIQSLIDFIRTCLEWVNAPTNSRPDYDKYFIDKGMFYLIIGLFDHLGLAEHGTSIRYPWLTDQGKKFLNALKSTTEKDLEITSDETMAYDGLDYGDYE